MPSEAPPIQSLAVVARLFPLILSGEKTATVRFGEARIAPGPMRYVCAGDPDRTVIVEVVRCTDMPLSEAARFLGREAEWPREVMLEGMREHYPEIEWGDIVQVIEHHAPAGTPAPGTGA
ncbi:ASCH domain-containing protein [Mesorhizobium sp. 10J20-29]